MVDFEWDKNKENKNRSKHNGVDFTEASTVFGDPFELTIPDPDHSDGEYRYISMGRSSQGRVLVVSYTEVAQDRIRIISARKAESHEKRQYENG
ncbi:MAG: BrnT family toxin [Thiolinea sp.]